MRRLTPFALAGLALVSVPVVAQDAEPKPAAPESGTLVPSKWLVLEAPDVRARRPIGASAVFARYLLDRDAAPPAAGDEVVGERGVPVKWTAVDSKEGTLDAGAAAVGYAAVECADDRVVLAEAAGVASIWVNGEPFAGDVYRFGLTGVPVPLRKGTNHVYVVGFRGPATIRFHSLPGGDPHPVEWDATRPDLAAGDLPDAIDAGVVVLNPRASTTRVLVGDSIAGESPDVKAVTLLPFGVTKVPVRLRMRKGDDGRAAPLAAVYVPTGDANARASAGAVAIRPGERAADAPHRLTRVSDIDGSVQEYAVLEPAPSVAPVTTRVVLSLHGAGVDCVGQARSYSRRPGFWIVAPTNRRPFGFDWQDWGRLDAYETLAAASERFGLPGDRVYLTGHSMGGHGTWHVAANDPDRFLAIAPSAGWASFDTYGGGPRPRSMLWPVWSGADAASDTLALVTNLAPLPTFVVHGTADDNVPLAQAETMLTALRDAGGTPAHHFQEGAGHWWDGDAAPGADCVDWRAVFDLFSKTEPAAAPAKLDWTTADPATDARHHWLQAVLPLDYGTPIRIRAAWDAAAARCVVDTTNARRINLAPPGADKWTAVLDGREIAVAGPNVWFERHREGWEAKANVQDERKKPSLSGPLKRAFARRFAVVLPTKGDPAETRETTARVRFDAQTWWVRANGFYDVVLDTDVLADRPRFEGRNLVLYGNADTNAAWAQVFGDASPIDVRRGAVTVGTRRWETASAACFFVRPRSDDAFAIAAALADTGPRGCRVAMVHALFSSGTGYPDYVAWDERALALADGGVLAAGWFDAFWNLDGRGFFAFGGATAPEHPVPERR